MRTDTTRREWKRAGNALQRLIRDPERTEEVFEIIDALNGPPDDGVAARARNDPAGARLLRERPDLLARLSDRPVLAALPEGTLGRAYADFMTGGNLSPDGLVEADVGRPDREPGDPRDDGHYLAERQRDAHDLWHVVTGYGMDEAGEVALLAFTYAQLGNLGILLIVGAVAVIGTNDLRLTWPRYLVRAFRRGRRARPLATVPWEDWLVRPLACVRRDLNVEDPDVAHPGGVLTGDRTVVLGATPAAAPRA